MTSLKEEEYVHKVYNEIASHFSETRYKPWPIVTEFLNEQTMGSIGIDVGCGNGKYLGINPNIYLIGSDHSSGLISCAHDIDNKYNIFVADGLHLPHKDNTFDFAISIAVVHHWASRDRRISAIKHILSKLKPGGKLLVYCWALEQGSSRRGYHEGMEQDVLVPWVLHNTSKEKKASTKTSINKIKHEKPDLSGIPPSERAKFVSDWKIQKQKEREEEAKAEAAAKKQQEEELEKKSSDQKENTKYRFYHLYRKGELEEDCESAGATVLKGGYERDNWYVVAQRT
ncbi:hypothetical protein TBLA_0A06960 [Henningerozyma blattae CBS 6284]|uniref:Methyltransferase type 11 domain-containing protein n=1 Tax=Henningerozyma blattae (strain ATCC 34711 / CBS 6284 / DSM 70876 / NBRC 10599 / NRRL Y-10934 / UCD 77-7) TaxID=1071380 RepID=I2GWI5_HENB6|nr:hypothetical protein TBLA_0A06960 [Tetrapisispora blattae CBS 6284]CCH58487.1 hypothetical protein TBLA_0A06960 [Tetrapisispora blattae CBS 6284]